jgi:hypothetical protein
MRVYVFGHNIERILETAERVFHIGFQGCSSQMLGNVYSISASKGVVPKCSGQKEELSLSLRNNVTKYGRVTLVSRNKVRETNGVFLEETFYVVCKVVHRRMTAEHDAQRRMSHGCVLSLADFISPGTDAGTHMLGP